ncbi:MAG: hypothetical protein C4297_14010 [Gemmataceae bacterium]
MKHRMVGTGMCLVIVPLLLGAQIELTRVVKPGNFRAVYNGTYVLGQGETVVNIKAVAKLKGGTMRVEDFATSQQEGQWTAELLLAPATWLCHGTIIYSDRYGNFNSINSNEKEITIDNQGN